MFKILCKGIVVENYVPKCDLEKTLDSWRNSGMSGEFTYFRHTPIELMKRDWSK